MEKTLAICLETVGCCIILAGIVVEVTMGADIGWILATSGAWVVSVGALLWAKVIRK